MKGAQRKQSLKWAFYGSSLVSAYWNGAATYYRGMIRSLANLGHSITFFEPDAYDRQKNRDIANPSWAKVHVYQPNRHSVEQALQMSEEADIIVKCSGVGVFDEELEAGVLANKKSNNCVIFWDVDAPATLDRMTENPKDPFCQIVNQFDLILTYGGGNPVVRQYKQWGARECIPIYNALDKTTHFRVQPDPKFKGILGFLGNRLPDREKRVEDFFLNPVIKMPEEIFILGGNGWGDKKLPPHIKYLGHVYTHEHNAFNSSTRAVLNLSRNSMANYGFSPATRIFEAAGAGACIMTDAWEGIELFLEPGQEVIVVHDGEEVIEQLRALDDQRANQMGSAAFARVCAHHTYEHRAHQLDLILREML